MSDMMQQQLTLAPMVRQEVPEVWEIEKLCFSLPWSFESFLLEVGQNQCARYYTARLDGRIIGYGGMWLVLDEAHVTNIAVHPEYRRRGIGKAVLIKMMEEAARLNIQRMTLEVRVSNAGAIALYEHLGFEQGGVRKHYYPDNREDALIMWHFHIGGMKFEV